jgi:hypothetical protein
MKKARQSGPFWSAHTRLRSPQGLYCFTASICTTRRTFFGKPQSTP